MLVKIGSFNYHVKSGCSIRSGLDIASSCGFSLVGDGFELIRDGKKVQVSSGEDNLHDGDMINIFNTFERLLESTISYYE